MVMRKFLFGAGRHFAGADLHHLRGRQPSFRDGVVESPQFQRSVGRGETAAVPRHHRRRRSPDVVAGGMATWFRQGRWRRAARQHEADARRARAEATDFASGCRGFPGRPTAPAGVDAARHLRGYRARQAGRDVVEPAPSAPLHPCSGGPNPRPRDHVPACQNLRPVHARDARRRAAGRRGHGGLCVLSAVAAAPRSLRRRANSASRPRGRAIKVALTVDADDATLENILETLRPDIFATTRQGNHGAAARHQAEIRTAGHEGAGGRDRS